MTPLTIDEIKKRLVEHRFGRFVQQPSNGQLEATDMFIGEHCMLGDKGNNSFLVYPRAKRKRDGQRLREQLITIFSDASNVEISDNNISEIVAAPAP